MNLFDTEYYPTPREVYELMGVDCSGKIVYDPSAGTGNLLGFMKADGAKQLLASEIEPDLRRLVGMKYDVIADDFFTVTAADVSHINMIVMNPPFSKADRHILHAWEVAPESCEIISLCNWQTIANTYSRSRTTLGKTIDMYGTAANLGDVFRKGADRTTGIEIGLIRLTKPVSRTDSDNFEGFYFEMDDQEPQENGIIAYDEIRATVQRYVAALKAFDEFEASRLKLADLVGLSGGRVSSKIYLSYEHREDLTKEQFLKGLQIQSWKHVFNKLEIGKYVTEGVMKELNKFIEAQQQLPFTMKNIYKMFEIIIATRGQTMQKAIVEAVDNFTQHTHENRFGLEGWKTNAGHLLNQKFIVSGIVKQEWFGSRIQINDCRNYRELNDLVKALCYLTATNFDDVETIKRASLSKEERERLEKSEELSWANWRMKGSPKNDKPHPKSHPYLYESRDRYPGFDNFETNKWYDWGFFEFKVFKKGTGHFRFKDEKVWEMLNMTYAKIKGQTLPEGSFR